MATKHVMSFADDCQCTIVILDTSDTF